MKRELLLIGEMIDAAEQAQLEDEEHDDVRS